MSLAGRLRLDEVISSVPELGPTVSDGGYSWIILLGSMLIQMTVPSIVSMYGVVLGHLSINSGEDLDLWRQKIALTPILFTAFWSIADPWTRMIINLASAPRIVGLIGVCLLSIGVLASGYLATGGVGAYLASLSAGAVMGIGGSFVLIQTETILRRSFRTHLRLVLILKDVATSLGFIFMPGFIFILLSHTSLQIGLLLMATSFIPTAIGSLTLRNPAVRPRASPYTLLIGEEDNELTSQVAPIDNAGDSQTENDTRGIFTGEESSQSAPPRLFGEGSGVYSYQDFGEDQELFSVNPQPSNTTLGWRSKIRLMKAIKFWVGAVAWIGCKTSALFIWILLPSSLVPSVSSPSLAQGVILSAAAGLGTLVPNVMSYWRPSTARWRSLSFGSASWLGSFVLLGLTAEWTFSAFIILAFIGGVSVGGTSVGLELALLDLLGYQSAKKAHAILSTIVGFSILSFSFISSPELCLRLTAAIQFAGGSYWILVPVIGIIRAR